MKNSRLKNLEEINNLRKVLEQMFLQEKIYDDKVSEDTVKLSQLLDIPIVEEQKRRLEEFNKSRIIANTSTQ